WPTNPPALVDDVIAALKVDAEAPVTIDGETLPLRGWLAEKRELTRLARPFVFTHAQRARHDDLDALIASPVAFPALLADWQLIDLLQAYPASWTAQDLVAALRPITPRLYSIASSLKVAEDEAHLTVARVGYEAFGRGHVGSASEFLSTRTADYRVPV